MMKFYHGLKPIQDLAQIGDMSFFVEAPADWMVLVSDVKGSTQAVQEGRAKDVNLLGASLITLISNETKTFNTISIFGGDGATVLVPREEFHRLRKQLVGLIRLSQEKLGLELRIGGVFISELMAQGHPVLVGRYQASQTTSLAQLAGSGVSLAEEWVKSRAGSAILLSAQEEWCTPNLNGLTCRMDSMPSRKGKILSLILKGQGPENSEWIRQVLVGELKKILSNNFNSGNPVQKSSLGWPWIPPTIKTEIKLQSNGLLQGLKVILGAFFSNFLIKLNISAFGFVPERYKLELPVHSDFHKYDDAFRMVIDCSSDQIQRIRTLLERAYREHRIYFGLHETANAVVTCMTTSPTTGHHVHFVDGEGCGYTMASLQLKGQISAALAI